MDLQLTFTMIEYQLVLTVDGYQMLMYLAVLLVLVMWSGSIGLREWSALLQIITLLKAIALLRAILAEDA
jgi:hypothetical protein